MLTYESQLPHLDQAIDNVLPRQVMDPARDQCGAIITDGLAGGSNVTTMTTLGYGYVCEGARWYRSEELVDRIRAGCVFAEKVRRPSGNFDLVTTNFDSSPDTAFIVYSMAPVVREARRQFEAGDEGAGVIAELLGALIRKSVPGIVKGGFHTPNHRWVICAALAQAFDLFPDLEGKDVVDRYLDETIDCNEDGEYTERSTSEYNAICNRALRLTAAFWNRPDLLDLVRRNLDMSYHLLHADGTIVTSISTRQDRGTRKVPVGLADSYYSLARIDGNGFYAAVADRLVGLVDRYSGALQPFLDHPAWRKDDLARESLPEDYSNHYGTSGLWRVRRGRASATVARGLTAPFSLKVGNLELSSVKVCASYFAVAQFEASEMETVAHGVRLTDRGRGSVHATPGYYQPTGIPVTSATWFETRPDRSHREMPALAMELEVVEVDSGFDLTVRTSGGIDRVPLQIEFDFVPGGELFVEGAAMKSGSGQVVLLESGYGLYRVGQDAVRIGPGNRAHRTWEMRGSETAPEAFRVLIPHLTHVDETIEIRYGVYAEGTGDLLSGR